MNILYHHRTRGQEVEGVHIRGMVNALRALGHDVDVLAPPGVAFEPQKAPPKTPGVEGAAKLSGFRPWTFFSRQAPPLVFEAAELAYNGYALPLLEGRLRMRPTSFIYERYALFLAAGVLAAERNRLPLVLEVNDSARVHRIRELQMQRAGLAAEQMIWQKASAIVTITGYFRDLIIEAGVPPERVHVIPNAVDEAAFSALPSGDSLRQRLGLGDAVVVGYVGAFNAWRRLDILLDAFAGLDARAKLLLIGDGPDRPALAKQIAALGLGDRVVFTGAVPHSVIPEHLACLDIAVIPHSNLYGSPMKVFEYMAAQKAVVAPYLPPVAEVLTPEEGRLFAPLDGDGLQAVLQELVGDAGLRKRLGARARQKALTNFVWRHHAQTVLDIVAQLEPL